MGKIPLDVMLVAEKAYSDAVRGGHDTRSFESRIIVIAQAIMEDRKNRLNIFENRLAVHDHSDGNQEGIGK